MSGATTPARPGHGGPELPAAADSLAAAELQRAASHALANGDVGRAARYLESAGERCRTEEQRLTVKIQLAEAYWHVRPADSAREYLSLKAPALAGKLTDQQALRVATGLLWHLQMDDAAEVIDHLPRPAAPGGPQASPGARYAQLIVASSFPGVRDRLRRPGPGEPAARRGRADQGPPDAGRGAEPGPPAVRAAQALVSALTQTADEATVDWARRTLDRNDGLSPANLNAVTMAVLSLIYADRLDAAAAWCDRALAGASGQEAGRERALTCCLGALTALRQGRLDVAARRAQQALSYYLPGRGWCIELGLTLATLVEARTAMGDHDAAAEHLGHPVPQAMFQTRAGLHYLFARGRHHLATGHEFAALADFMACGERMTRWGIDTPALVPWRVGAAEAWLSLDETARAARLMEEQAARLGDGLTRASGITLRGLAAVQEAARRPAILHKALQVLQDCGDRYETARAFDELSRAYRALGARRAARAAAMRAWRLAKACHARTLCQEQAVLNRELWPMGSAGGQPGREPLLPEGELAKLSSSERRVALLAAEGYSNREISSKLFVTVSTVEQHLTRVYRKMNIKSRDELPTGS
jgi:DNA-binding CsgD family transcriptional regulator/tetratricopeptide (TPR) repeat protein